MPAFPDVNMQFVVGRESGCAASAAYWVGVRDCWCVNVVAKRGLLVRAVAAGLVFIDRLVSELLVVTLFVLNWQVFFWLRLVGLRKVDEVAGLRSVLLTPVIVLSETVVLTPRCSGISSRIEWVIAAGRYGAASVLLRAQI